MFHPDVYAHRRAALVRELASRGVDAGLAFFPGHREAPVNYADNCYPFRQDSSFLYFFGLREPGLAATIDLGTGSSILYAEDQDEDGLVWSGPRPGAAELAASCAAEAHSAPAALGPALARETRSVLYLPPYRAETRADLASLLSLPYAAVDSGASPALVKAVVALREIKEDREVACIEAAVGTTVALHRAVMAAARPGVAESALMAIAWKEALAAGGLPSFPPIATTRGAVLHNHGYGGVLREGGLFLLDAGAEDAEGYAGDLTSTFPIGKRYGDRQRAVYSIVLEAGRAAAARALPGVPFREAHFAAALAVAAGLRSLGVMKGDVEEAVQAGAHALFFPHGVGHQMGLDVHDMEALGEVEVGYGGEPKSAQFGLKSLRMAKALKPGMAVTVEPGVYFIEGLIARWKAAGKFASFIDYAEAERWSDVGGIRNEEDWLVGEAGPRRLGPEFDKSPEAMEAYRS